MRAASGSFAALRMTASGVDDGFCFGFTGLMLGD